jgi:hypothetical protein
MMDSRNEKGALSFAAPRPDEPPNGEERRFLGNHTKQRA